MQVSHIYKSYFPDTFGGVEEVIKNISASAKQLDVDSSLITLSKNPALNEKINTLNISRYPTTIDIASCPMSLKLFYQYKQAINKADILHYHFPWPFADLMHVFNRIKKPSIVTYHSDIVRQSHLKKVYGPLMKSFLSKVDKIAVTSQKYLDTSDDLKPYKDKCTVIPLGIDAADYPEPIPEKLHQWQQKIAKPFGLFIGVLRYYKGLHILLDACENSDVPIVIAGGGPEEKALKAQAEKLRLNNIYFVGRVSDEDKQALLKLCRFVIMPSHLRSEAFGVSLIEGLLFGKPLISCEIGTGTSFVNEDNITGLVVPPNDPQALNYAMKKLYNDDSLIQSMGHAAHQRYQQLFTAAKMGKRYVDLYTNITQVSGAPRHSRESGNPENKAKIPGFPLSRE